MSEQCGGKKKFCVGSCGNGKPGLREEEGRGYALDTLAREIPGYLQYAREVLPGMLSVLCRWDDFHRGLVIVLICQEGAFSLAIAHVTND